jgi:hypothetical protein
MAELLGVSQAEVSKMERQTELYVGTLRKFIEAMNGEPVVAARFATESRSRFPWQRKKTQPESRSSILLGQHVDIAAGRQEQRRVEGLNNERMLGFGRPAIRVPLQADVVCSANQRRGALVEGHVAPVGR